MEVPQLAHKVLKHSGLGVQLFYDTSFYRSHPIGQNINLGVYSVDFPSKGANGLFQSVKTTLKACHSGSSLRSQKERLLLR